MSLGEWWRAAKRSGVVYWILEHAPRSNMSAYYSLYTVSRGRLERAWPDAEDGFDAALAKELGFSLRRRAWRRNGCGYNRPHDVMYSIARHFEKRKPGTPLEVVNRISLEGLNVS